MVTGDEAPMLEDILANFDDRNLLHVIIEAAAKNHVTRYDVVGRSRELNAVQARRDAIARLYEEFGRSSKEIGTLLDIDASTVWYALKVSGVRMRKKCSGKAA